jgi:hypothetical protein
VGDKARRLAVYIYSLHRTPAEFWFGRLKDKGWPFHRFPSDGDVLCETGCLGLVGNNQSHWVYTGLGIEECAYSHDRGNRKGCDHRNQ